MLPKIKIIDLYLSGLSCYKIAKIYNCSAPAIHEILKKSNTPRRSLSTAMIKYSHNVNFFKKINTKEKAYFLGLLYADGNITNNVISISLHEQDKPILDKFKKVLNYTGPLYLIEKSGKRANQWKLGLTSPILISNLLKHGLYPNKGFTLTFPKTLPKKLYSHFIRGYFDGDGCIYSNPKNQDYLFSMVSTKEVLTFIQEILITNLGLNKTKLYNPPKVKGKNLYILTYQGKNNVLLIRDFLYKESTIFLERKYDKFFSI